MAYRIQKLNQISNRIRTNKVKLMRVIGQDGRDKMKEYVEMHWYGAYTPKDYERTNEVLDCITYKIEGDTVVIFYDEDKLSQIHNLGNWGSHLGFNDQEFKIEYIEKGVNNGVETNPRIGDSGANAIARVRGWLANYITKVVQEIYGVNVKARARR